LMVDLKHTKEIISVLGEIENTEEGIPEWCIQLSYKWIKESSHQRIEK
jgi:hypothetical protein